MRESFRLIDFLRANLLVQVSRVRNVVTIGLILLIVIAPVQSATNISINEASFNDFVKIVTQLKNSKIEESLDSDNTKPFSSILNNSDISAAATSAIAGTSFMNIEDLGMYGDRVIQLYAFTNPEVNQAIAEQRAEAISNGTTEEDADKIAAGLAEDLISHIGFPPTQVEIDIIKNRRDTLTNLFQ